MLPIARIGPAQRRNFKPRLLETIIPSSRASNRSIGNFVGRLSATRRQRKCYLQQNMSFMPVDIIADHRMIGACIENDILHKL